MGENRLERHLGQRASRSRRDILSPRPANGQETDFTQTPSLVVIASVAPLLPSAVTATVPRLSQGAR